MKKAISVFVLSCFLITSIMGPNPVFAQDIRLPAPGLMVNLSPAFIPAHLQGVTIHPDDPFKFDFLIHRGDGHLSQEQKKFEYTKLIKYFLASLTIPDNDQWVNLSPYEHDRIIADNFGMTEMGRDLLGQDYLLKQITSSLIYPERALGKKFWDKVYERAWKQYGTTNIPVNTFNKVWIIPDQAAVYESGNTVYILRNHLKVMLEEDYLSLSKHAGIVSPSSSAIARSPQGDEAISKRTASDTHTVASQVIKEIILPALEKEVNEGKNFAQLRQIYSGMILATWYKHELKESLLGKIYANNSKVKGVDQNPKNNEQIYQEYLKAFKKGVFNYIKEDADKYTQERIPRKYFSGGIQDFSQVTAEVSNGFKDAAVLVLNGSNAGMLPRSVRVIIGNNSDGNAQYIDRVITALDSTIIQRTTIKNAAMIADPQRFQRIADDILKINPEADIDALQRLYAGVEEKFQKPEDRLYSDDGKFRILLVDWQVTEMMPRGVADNSGFLSRYGQPGGKRRIYDHPLLSIMREKLGIQDVYYEDQVNGFWLLGRHFQHFVYSRHLYVPVEHEALAEMIVLVGYDQIRKAVFRDVSVEDDVRLGVRVLGQGSYQRGMGNKEASFLIFEKLGLPYPPGVVLSEQLARDIFLEYERLEKSRKPGYSFDDKKSLYTDPLRKTLKVGDIDWHRGDEVMIRSSPKQSMPGVLATTSARADYLIPAIFYVASSWFTLAAKAYRKRVGLPDEYDLPIIIQKYFSGERPKYPRQDYNSKELFASGVFFTSDPNTGEDGLFGQYIENASGDELMTAKKTYDQKPINNITELETGHPEIYRQILQAKEKLERELQYPQEVEFVVHNGKIWFLSTRSITFAPSGLINYINKHLTAGTMEEAKVVSMLAVLQTRLGERILYKVRVGMDLKLDGKADTSTPGAMQGHSARDIGEARELMKEGKPLIVFLNGREGEEFLQEILNYTKIGVVTTYGNESSHEVALLRDAGIPALIRYPDFSLPENGEIVVIDGNSNALYRTADNIIEEDRVVMDASYGIHIPTFRAEFLKPYFSADGSIKEEFTVERLEELNQQAQAEWDALEKSDDRKARFVANLKKHFLHDLLRQKQADAAMGSSLVDIIKREVLKPHGLFSLDDLFTLTATNYVQDTITKWRGSNRQDFELILGISGNRDHKAFVSLVNLLKWMYPRLKTANNRSVVSSVIISVAMSDDSERRNYFNGAIDDLYSTMKDLKRDLPEIVIAATKEKILTAANPQERRAKIGTLQRLKDGYVNRNRVGFINEFLEYFEMWKRANGRSSREKPRVGGLISQPQLIGVDVRRLLSPFINKVLANPAMQAEEHYDLLGYNPAMTQPDIKGGIDLNSANLNLQIKRDGKGVPLPISQQDMAQLSRIQGFVPRIIEIKPAAGLSIFQEITSSFRSSQ